MGDELKTAVTEGEGRSKKKYIKCERCKNELGTVDHWFDYAVKPVKFGYTMLPVPLCKECFDKLERFFFFFDVK